MKTLKKFAALALATLMLISTFGLALSADTVTATAGWTADENGVYNIGSAADLLAFAENAEANKWYKNKLVKLTADIDMKDVEWTPVEKFRGFFEGMGYAIQNLSLSSATSRLAFINVLDDATIRNVQFTDAIVYSTEQKYSYAAVVAVETTGDCTFDNVYVDGTVSASGANTAYIVGGFVAQVTDGTTTITNCVSLADFVSGNKTVGGFIGTSCYGSNTVMTNCVFSGSYGEVRVETGMIGRLVGTTTMKNCVSTASDPGFYEQWDGKLFYLDCNDFANGNVSSLITTLKRPINVTVEDCYVTLQGEKDFAIGAHGSRNLYNTVIKYTGEETPAYTTPAETGATDYKASSAAVKTLAVGSDVTLTKDNLATVAPALADVMVVTDQMVKFGVLTTGEGEEAVSTDLMINLILPITVQQMLTDTLPTPEMPDLSDKGNDTQGGNTSGGNTSGGNTTGGNTTGGNTQDKDDTTTSADDSTDTSDSSAKKKSGCKSVSSVLFAGALTLAAIPAVCVRKKKED